MENLIIEKDTQENAIRFLDTISKSLEGLKDKYTTILVETQSKNEKLEPILKNWVNGVNDILTSKFEEIYEIKTVFDEKDVLFHLKNWCVKYKDNVEFIMNIKVIFKNLQFLRSTIKSKLSASDSLSNISLTENLINRNKNCK